MHRSKIFAPLIAVALLLAACGDDDDTSTATDDTVADDESTETTTEEETEDGGDSDLDEEAMAEGMGECGFLTGFATAFEDFDPTTMYGGEEATDFGQIFAPLAEATEDVAEAAPDEIRDAFRTMAEGFSAVAAELEGVVVDFSDPESMDPETMAKLESLGDAFGDEYEAAAEEIDVWVNENCADLADTFDLDGFGS
jgi:ABC-type enterochelin transport system substrate-binding protein